MAVLRPQLIFKSIIPVIMAGMLGIYGLIVGIMLSGGITDTGYTYKKGYAHLGRGGRGRGRGGHREPRPVVTESDVIFVGN